MRRMHGQPNVTPSEKAFDMRTLERQPYEKHPKPLRQVEKEEAETGKPADLFFKPQEKPGSGGLAAGFFSQSNEATLEEGLSKLLSTITNPARLAHFTELTDKELKAIAALEAINIKLQSPILTKYLESLKEHRVSLKRTGRHEIVEIAKSLLAVPAQAGNGLVNMLKGVVGK